jgi:two-component sensor histidine kinase
MKAHHHPRQAERLASLYSYAILDTPREEDFDDIARLASEICGTPIAVVNLIDADRQWFKAEVGLGVSETPIDTSICSHVILEQDFTEIEDTHRDPRTADNPLCAPDDGLRFYAGALLKGEDGLPIGTLCVLDQKPRVLTEQQRRALTVLARRVMRELDLRKALRTQHALREEVDHRVKNSLAIVSAAVRLYKAEALKTGDAATSFDQVQRHLDAVSAVHRSIYLSDEVGSLGLKGYLATLAEHLEASLSESISVSAQAADLAISPRMASCLGLVINEFVANTFKHGLTPGSRARIDIDASKVDGALRLACRNDAPDRGAAPDGPSTGIGARLMASSVAQFGGHLEQTSRAGGVELVAVLPLETHIG